MLKKERGEHGGCVASISESFQINTEASVCPHTSGRHNHFVHVEEARVDFMKLF